MHNFIYSTQIKEHYFGQKTVAPHHFRAVYANGHRRAWSRIGRAACASGSRAASDRAHRRPRASRPPRRSSRPASPARPVAAVIADDSREHPAIRCVEAEPIDLELAQRMVDRLARDDAVIIDLRKIAHAAQHPVGDTRRAAAADASSSAPSGSICIPSRLAERVMMRLSSSGEYSSSRKDTPKRSRSGAEKLTGARRRTDKREARQIEPDRVGRGPLPTMMSMAKSSIAG